MKQIILALRDNKLLRKSLVDTNYYLLSQLASKLLTLLVIPILARIVSVEEFGFYDAFLLYSSFLLLLATLGIDSGLGVFIVENSSDEKMLNFYYTFSLAIGAGVIIFIVLICFLIQYFYQLIPSGIFVLVLVNLIFGFFSYTAFNFLRWLGQSKAAAIITFISTTTGIIIGIIPMLAANSQDIKLFIGGLVVGNLVSAVICIWITRKYISFKLVEDAKGKLWELLKVSVPFLPNYLANNLLLLSDRILIMTFLSAHSYGQYSMVSRIAQIPSFAVQVLNKGFLPVLFQNHATEEGKKFNRKVLNIYILSLIPVFFIFLIGGKFLLILFAGSKYQGVSHLVLPMMLGVLFFGSMGFNGFGFSIKRKTLIITFITFGAVFLNVLLTFTFINTYGLGAVAISIMIASAASSIVYTWQSEKLYEIGYNLRLMIVVFGLLCVASTILTINGISTLI